MPQNKVPKSLKFLDAYEKNDRGIFFQRDDTIAELYRTVNKSNLTVVFGFSGTGKTSLIQCGLANQFSDTDWMEVLIRKKRNQPINESTFESIQSRAKTLFRPIHQSGSTKDYLIECLEQLYRDYFRTIYLIYDQFEELFIYGTEEEQRDFISFLKACVESNLNVKVILVVREEYLGSLYEFEGRKNTQGINGLEENIDKNADESTLPGIMDNYFRVGRLSKIVVKNLISDILTKNGIKEFENLPHLTKLNEHYSSLDLIYDNIKDKETKMVDLPNLQVYLDKLLRSLPEGTTKLLFADLAALGKVDDILAEFLDEKVESIRAGLDCKIEDIWGVLNMLVSVNETKQGLKKEEIRTQLSN
ncbi:MAG: hypothetical protein E6H09_02310 [Bacteroidetes bacterium]|nr:MAG: hypothetical protein E6H09_02310 [Bacteroidota bacterium]